LNPTYNHKARGKGKSGKSSGLSGLFQGFKKVQGKHPKNTFGTGLNNFEQGKDLKGFKNQSERGKSKCHIFGISKI
jgi:hypothetical protein